ncbi:hypothetical protein AAP_01160 [Ascosphaera apis ARSEF 7405]|uniref:Uncharacterized protein n=1 Tax=Ascosphaera apis ARSEF 7405 TaxID=392613 RepID=A0A168CBI7_9EURO|nr:hypothetical protein AAP_01160 [Ascosphaera apis ARSEF 7405]
MASSDAEKFRSSVKSEAVGYSDEWRQGFWRRFPWTGMISLLVVILCLIFNIIILVVSNGMLVNKWGIQPSVLIAISTAIGNGLLRVAFVQGGMITWWRNAMSGCSITRLSQLWTMYNENPLLLFKKFHPVALATIAVLLAPTESPLFQRAQTVETKVHTSWKDLPVSIAQQIPQGYTGNIQARPNPTLTSMTDTFRSVYLAYANREPMYLETPGYDNANYTASVRAAGFKVKCKQHAVPRNFGWIYTLGHGVTATMDNVSDHITTGVHGPYTSVFKTELSWKPGQPSLINLTAMWKEDGGCVSQIQVKECTFETATLNYSVQVERGQVMLRDDLNALGMNDSSIVDTYDYKMVEMNDGSTLGGFYMVGKDLFTSVGMILQQGSSRVLSIDTNGTLVQQTAVNLANATTSVYNLEACNVTFRDPTYLIVSGFQEMMFRTSLAAANDTSRRLFKNDNQTLPVDLKQTSRVTLKESQAVFQLHPGFLGGAAAVSFTCLCVVAVTFWGWWTLGQKVTMNPIALSRAFGSPLLETDNPVEAERAKVKYGPDGVAVGADQTASEESGSLMRSASVRPRFTFVDE